MQVDEIPTIDPNEDLTQILPIEQKRTIAFANYFIMKTVSHLNNFAQSCESRFMEFEYKIQKIEASLLILESQLSSISGLEHSPITQKESSSENPTNENIKLDLPEIDKQMEQKDTEEIPYAAVIQEQEGTPAKDDPRFIKFFKMLQFGVPEPAVKLKMKNEGFDPSILHKPNDVIPGISEH